MRSTSNKPPKASRHDATDHERLRHARERHVGFHIGRYLQPAPMLFTRDGHNAFLGDMYRGRPAFLVCSGPSLTSHDLSKLQERGVLTLAVNNAATVIRPSLWCSVDDPGNFSDAIWRDPGITKFVPLCHMEKKFTVRDDRNELVPSEEQVGDAPAVFGFRRNETFNAEQWLYEDTFNWGNHSKLVDAYSQKGSRSVMYVALRMLFYLGVRKIYLLGCDFRMEEGKQNYAFPQDRTRSSVKGNNSSYKILDVRLRHLKPHFEQAGLEVFNCTPQSGLTAFPHRSFEEAIIDVRRTMPQRIITAGMYERQSLLKAEREKVTRPSPAPTVAAPRTSPAAPASQVATDQPAPTAQIAAPQPLAAIPAASKSASETRTRSTVRVSPPAPRASATSSAHDQPEFSIVTWIDDDSVANLRFSWETWSNDEKHKAATTIVFHPAGFASHKHLKGLTERPSIRFVPWSADTDTIPSAATRLSALANNVSTPWYLQLDPRVMVAPAASRLRNDWFAPDPIGRLPVSIGDPIVLSDYPEALERLNRWGDADEALSKFSSPARALKRSSAARRATLPLGSCYFANTSWVAELNKLGKFPTDIPLELIAAYVALRRGDYAVTVDMAKQGWEFVRGPLRHLKRRATALVG